MPAGGLLLVDLIFIVFNSEKKPSVVLGKAFTWTSLNKMESNF